MSEVLLLRLFRVLKAAPLRILPAVLFTATWVLSGETAGYAQTGCEEVETCLKQLESSDPSARTGAVYNLGNLRDPKAVPPLIKLIEKEEDSEVQRTAVRSLGMIGDSASANALGEILQTQPHLRDDAVQAIIRIGGKSASDSLVRALEIPGTRMAAIQGLGEIGDRSAREPLLSLYRNTEDERIRGLTSIAIQRIRSRLGPTEEEMGVPIYPGSGYFPNALAEWIFTTADPVEKVEDFYREALKSAPLDFAAFKQAHEKTFQSVEEAAGGTPADPPDFIFVVEVQAFEGGDYPSKMVFLKRLPKKTEIRIFEAEGG